MKLEIFFNLKTLIQVNFYFILFSLTVNASTTYKNVIMIVADDLGWSDVGYYDSTISTPNINSLANNGIMLNNTYAYSTCTPSRASLLTGYFAEKTGLQYDVLTATMPYGLPVSFRIMPQYFKDYGYDTYAIGKWNMGFCNLNYTPVYRGFDSFYGYYNAAEDYYYHNVTLGTFTGLDFIYQNSTTSKAITDQNGTHSMTSFTNQALSLLSAQNLSKNFFMYFSVQNVHDILALPTSYYNKYSNQLNTNRRSLLGLVTQLDDAVGQIVTKLTSLGILNNTIIAFTSDNGASVTNGGSSYPLRGMKGTLYEGGHKVRAFISNPTLKSYVNSGQFHISDWLPTLIGGAVGANITGLDGANQWPQISTQKNTTRTSFIYNIQPYGAGATPYIASQAIRYGDYKLISGCPGLFSDIYQQWNKTANVLTPADYTYCNSDNNSSSTRTGATLLFNLANDPYETTNLATNASYASTLSYMNSLLATYVSSSVTPLMNPNTTGSAKSNPSKFNGMWTSGWC